MAKTKSTTLKIGDVVRLKSGGPAMTVITKPDVDGEVECTWFVGADATTSHGDCFPAAALALTD